MDRKDFIKKMAGTMLFAVPAITVLGCSDSDNGSIPPQGGPPQSADCLKNGTKNAINGNHGHEFKVSKEDVKAGTTKDYSITGTASHSHTITVSSDNFDNLKRNQQIEMTSTNGNGHTHVIIVSCA